MESDPLEILSVFGQNLQESWSKNTPGNPILPNLVKIQAAILQKLNRITSVKVFLEIKVREIEFKSIADLALLVGESNAKLNEVGAVNVELEIIVRLNGRCVSGGVAEEARELGVDG